MTFFLRFIYLAALSLCCYRLSRAAESGGPLHLRAPRWGGFSGCEAQAPGASAAAAHGLRSTGSRVVMLRLSGSAEHGILRTRDQTPIFCIGRQILNHSTTEVPRDELTLKQKKRFLNGFHDSFTQRGPFGEIHLVSFVHMTSLGGNCRRWVGAQKSFCLSQLVCSLPWYCQPTSQLGPFSQSHGPH